MSTELFENKEAERRRRSMMLSVFIHVGLMILCLLPILSFQVPPPEKEAIILDLGAGAALGEPDQGMNDEKAGADAAEASQPEIQEEEVTPPPPQEETKPKSEPKPKEVVKTENPEEIALKKQKAEKERREREEAERIRKEEEARKKAAEEEARRKAEEEARKKAEYESQKSKIGGMFKGSGKGNGDGSGTGAGKGTGGKAGNQGIPGGDPNADNLGKVGGGSGVVNGFGSRGFRRPQPISESFSNTGKVVINVCVDAGGKVISAVFTQKGSTTTDATLRRLAEEHALKYRFDPSEVDKQCGTIVYEFIAK